MINIDLGSFIFGFFCCSCLVIAYYFGKLAMGNGECCEFDEDEYDEYDECFNEEVNEDA